MERILISACLLGRPVRYDGRGKELRHDLIARWQAEGRLVPVCPEALAGFPTPRPPAEIESGRSGPDVLRGEARILESGGRDVTEAFLDGARAALQAAKNEGCRFALLADGSPSCGSTFIHDGSFVGVRKPGQGVVTALLRDNGVSVFPECAIEELGKRLGRPR